MDSRKIMAGVLIFLAALPLIFLFMFIIPILSALVGAFSGWVLSLAMPVWIPTGLSYIGIKITPEYLPELGAALGFVGGFFKSYKTSSKSSD